MTQREIVEQLAQERRVEQLANAVCKEDTPLVRDLIQEMYLALLTMNEERIERAHREGWLPFLIVNMLKTAWNSPRSSFRTKFCKFSRRSSELTQQLADDTAENNDT